ncbi:DUF3732 domain-containing protein [Bacteroides sp.]|uniref:DUF3732 domain-containing protein n=1 Tax=Bacteroides sp. TaxID=29523 RepID=UPI00258BFC8E|nr:DUF3732 domain-containing protein [Bacteroides sp.]
MQIQNIILYKDAEHNRVLTFETGKVNIITGESKSGKTAIINIVDYCLGSKDCKIADGVIRDNVQWFAITVVFNNDEQYVIARLNPNIRNANTITEIYIENVDKGVIPEFKSLHANSNIIALKDFLSKKIGIAENLQVAENNTRDSLEVNFKHARLFCFQPQTLIAQQDYLFYKQTEPFVPQAIKDSLPYFLGAIREDSLKIEQEIAQKKRILNRLVRTKNEAEKIYSDGISMAFALIEEAKEYGLLQKGLEVSSISEALAVLNTIKDWEYNSSEISVNGENSTLKKLIEQRNEQKIELGHCEDTISATKTFLQNNFYYAEEVIQQKIRLESVGLFNDTEADNTRCPLCYNKLETPIPSINAIHSSLNNLNKSLEETVREKPRLTKYLQDLCLKRDSMKDGIIKTETAINALYKEQEEARLLRDLNLRRGKVIGRISLFLESVDFSEDKTIDNQITAISNEINNLSQFIDKESKEDKLHSIINKINLFMSNWVKDLDVEYENALIRFDLSKLTLIADLDDKSIPLSQMGSGANWVSYHLLIHFALHQHFIQTNRPIPHFLIIDQPTQVYFPPEKDINNDGIIQENSDEIAVKKMFDFIINRTNSLNSNFQVIITDHAYLNEDNFKNHVREVWRNGEKLIPKEWYKPDNENVE